MKTGHVFKGDARAWLKGLEPESAQLVIADPPYFRVLGHDWDRQWRTEEDYLSWSLAWLSEAMRVLRENGLLYCFGQLGKREHAFLHLCPRRRGAGSFTTSSPGIARWATTSGAIVSRRRRN